MRKPHKVTIHKVRQTWWLNYYLDGQRIRESLGTHSQKIAERKRDEKEKDILIGRAVGPQREVPVKSFLDEYLLHAKGHKRPSTVASDKSRLTAFFGGTGIQHLHEVDTGKVQRYLDTEGEKRQWSPATRLRYREILHAAFEYARKLGYVQVNPVTEVARPQIPDHDVRWLDEDQYKAVLGLVKGDLIAPMVAVYIYAGLRREEAVWLTWRDLDLNVKRPTLKVVDKEVNGEKWRPKTRNHVIPIHRPGLLPVLVAHAATHKPAKGSEEATTKPWVFLSPQGCRWDPDNLSHRFRAIMGKAGLPWTLLDLRHTYGSMLAQKGLSDYEIATLMGNSPEIVRKHYARLRRPFPRCSSS